MDATKLKFSPSVNILRDIDYTFDYINSANSIQVFTSILNDALVGIKNHVIIGAYGSGKSSFLLAFQQTLEKRANHFKGFGKLLNTIPTYEFLPIIGEFTSLEGYFAEHFNLGKKYTTAQIFIAVDKYYKALKKQGKSLAIVIDEFGKFLEYAALNNPESELYFIQQLAEWISDSKNDVLLISTLHQDFSAYSFKLDKLQRNEWNKVKGRLKETPFNEPVEHLLYLASERIDQKFQNKSLDKNFNKLFSIIETAKAFPLKDYFNIEFAKKLYPFDILSAGILALSLQKYGQNERSLFSFIESKEYLGISEFDSSKAPYYSLAYVYDYLLNSYYPLLTTKNNPHLAQWSAIRIALEKSEGLFDLLEDERTAKDIIKSIGLLNIYATGAAKLSKEFYYSYAKFAVGSKNAESVIKRLEATKLIRYINHSFRYIIAEMTDLDIDLAIDDAGKLVEKVTQVVNHLNLYFDFPFVPAKAVYYEKGTPRFFQFKLSEDPLQIVPEGEVDGFINLVFSEDSKAAKKIQEISSSCNQPILYGYYKNTNEIKNILFEIQKVQKVKESNSADKPALKELDGIYEHYVRLLNHYVLDNLYTDNENIVWFYNGNKIKINSRTNFNKRLSSMCNDFYVSTPIFKSELINKTFISSQISKARNNILNRVKENLQLINLGFNDDEFPPEKSIYLTLLKETGMHQFKNGLGLLGAPQKESFIELWEAGNSFLDSTKTKSRNLQDFIELFSTKPFKLKKGFVDIWIPIFLLSKSDEFALYETDAYIPELNGDILDLMNKKPGLFFIKAFDFGPIKLELFNRYRIFLNQTEHHSPNNKTLIQTIRPFISFYKELTDYSRKTNRLGKKTIALRNVIAVAKDPEKAFFDDFPTALGYSLEDLQKKPSTAEKFIKDLQASIRELRSSYEELLIRFETFFIEDVLGNESTFPNYKKNIVNRFKGLKEHLLLKDQKVFYSRLQSQLNDRQAWLAGIAQACINKPLQSITDVEEIVLFEKVKNLVYELDNLCEMSKTVVDENSEEVIKLEITSFIKGINTELLRIPKGKNKQLDEQLIKIKSNLGNDKRMNIAALTKLLNELLNEDGKEG